MLARGCMVLWTTAAVVLAQEAPGAQHPVTVPAGVPLRVALERRVPITRAGEPIRGRLVEPVYVFDRVALPAGSVVEGRIADIGGVPASRRFTAILSGNFTPAREVRAQFDAVVLSDGSRLSLRTSPAGGTAHTVRVAKPRKQRSTAPGDPKGSEETDRAASLAFTAPGKISQLKSRLLGMLPYHRQAWTAGTLFDSVLREPLETPPAPGHVEARSGQAGGAGLRAQEVRARLLTSVSSATARRGTPVEAVVTQPLFSSDHGLLIPEGSRLIGDVVEARPARRFHRNGRVLFLFRQLKLPAGAVQGIQGYLEGVEADFDAHLTVDSEGATQVSSPKSRFVFPALAGVAAGLSFHQDYNAQGVPDQDIAGRAESGAVGLGVIGTVLAQTSRTLASSIAFTGAGYSVYSTFLARGEEVVLRANTPVTISLMPRGGEAGGAPRAMRPDNEAAGEASPAKGARTTQPVR